MLTETDVSTLDPDTSQFVSNPVVCTSRGSALLFENLKNDTYPVYAKDSLLNTNEDFDFGEFNELAAVLAGQVGEQTINSFVFTFNEPGAYVFADSRNEAKQMVIAVMRDD